MRLRGGKAAKDRGKKRYLVSCLPQAPYNHKASSCSDDVAPTVLVDVFLFQGLSQCGGISIFDLILYKMTRSVKE